METKIDACGLSCPQPVLLAYRAIEAGSLPLVVSVDNPTAKENVRRMAEGRGLTVAVSESDGVWELAIS